MSTNYPLIEGMEIRPKDDWRGWHKIVPAFFFLWGLINESRHRDFYSNYYTTLGNCIYVPVLSFDGFVKNPPISTIRHERVHYLDDMAHPIFYKLSYVFSKKWRAHWEKRGYVQNMIVEKERHGYVTAHMKNHVKKKFMRGSIYLINMDPYKADRMINEMAANVDSGKWSGTYPDVR
jgi:hypothetical protein